MEVFRDVLLDVWREACRHIEISESTAAISQMLTRHLPIEVLLVRRFHEADSALETVGAGGGAEPLPTASGQSTATPDLWKRLQAWGRDGELARAPARRRVGIASVIVPPELTGAVVAGPLEGPNGPAGALVLVATAGEEFHRTHESMIKALLEPFSAALENDRRLHELNALREAAEADRRSLLHRLGRQDLQEAVVGAETGLRNVMERVELVAQSDVPVLILGETGTGKEVVSRAIHNRSSRADGPFIRVNCGAIPSELIDSQLFGHEKGSFTGAVEQHHGWFERADGGTLFLDEIGELPLPAQVRLLRVLQDHQVERVGGRQPIHVNVRIVAATHRDLASMVKTRSFRDDLWYRINVFPILLPRLRDRIEDIPALVKHFVQRAANRFGLPFVEISPEDMRLLVEYPWPGNIRELGAVIDRAAILGNGRSLEVAKALGLSLPAPATPPTAPAESVAAPTTSVVAVPSPLPPPGPVLPLADAMKEHIERALAATHGRIEGRRGTAALLGINPHTLRARMRKLKIDWDRFRDHDL